MDRTPARWPPLKFFENFPIWIARALATFEISFFNKINKNWNPPVHMDRAATIMADVNYISDLSFIISKTSFGWKDQKKSTPSECEDTLLRSESKTKRFALHIS
jgi:hypothetical protein